jgi:hypothetical protein
MTQPTETPPGEGSTGMVLHEHSNDSNSGPLVGNRTPMAVTFVALGILGLLLLGVVVFGIVEAVR